MIRRNWLAFVGGAVVLVGVALFAVAQAGEEQATPGPNGPSQQPLLERLKALEARVAQLEQRAAPPTYPAQVVPPLYQPIPPSYTMPPGTPPSLPEGSTPREFNGTRYYIVPIDKSAPTR